MSDSTVSEKEEQTVSTVSLSSVSVDGTRMSVSTVEVSRWSATFHHKNLARSMGAIASLAGAVSVLFGVLATHMAPHGWSKVKVALHLAKKPLILKLAPYIAGFALAAATAAGILSFYSWYREGRDARRDTPSAGAPSQSP